MCGWKEYTFVRLTNEKDMVCHLTHHQLWARRCYNRIPHLSQNKKATSFSETAFLLKQPVLIKYLISSLDNSNAQFGQKAALRDNLSKLLAFYSQKEDLSKDNLIQINSLATAIINQFN